MLSVGGIVGSECVTPALQFEPVGVGYSFWGQRKDLSRLKNIVDRALAVCLAVACLSPLASSAPDGLERVAEDEGFAGLATQSPFQIIADYLFPGMVSETTATILAGVIGTLALFCLAWALAWGVVSLRKRTA